MTDIEAKAAKIAIQFGMWPDGSFAEIIATALREARTAALEEAAKEVADMPEWPEYPVAPRHIISEAASRIRALKDTTP
jgi:hypothetical protein